MQSPQSRGIAAPHRKHPSRHHPQRRELEHGRAFLGGLVKGTTISLIHFSSDLVFNGRKEGPYTEEDKADPVSVCGKSRLAGEQALLELGADNICIIRTGWLFGPGGDNFVSRILTQARTEPSLEIIHDQIGSPSYTVDVAQATVQLVKRKAQGLYHVANSGRASWCELAAEAVRQASLPCKIGAVATGDGARRAANEVLSSAKYAAFTGSPLRPWPQALREYIYTELLSGQ